MADWRPREKVSSQQLGVISVIAAVGRAEEQRPIVFGRDKKLRDLRSDGKVGRATLNQGGQDVGIGGVVVHKRALRQQGDDALIVELKGTTRRLSAIQVAKLDLVLDLEPQVKNLAHTMPRQLERLPLKGTVLNDRQ